MNEERIKPGYYPDFPVDRILEPKFSFRRNVDEGIGDLVEEIKAAGMVIEPIVCRPSSKTGYIELGPGERRLRAAKKLGMKTVPVIVKEVSDAEFDRIRLLENLARKDLSDMEIARVLRYMLDSYPEEYPTQEDLAKAFGKSVRWVKYHLRMLQLENVFKEREHVFPLWTEILSKITEGQARQILSVSQEKRVDVAEWIVERYEETGEIPSAREIREYVQGLIKPEVAEESPEEAEAQPLTAVIPTKLEKPEDYVKAAEELMRRAEELKTPEEKFDERASEVLSLIERAENLGLETKDFRDRIEKYRKDLADNPDDALKRLDRLRDKVEGVVERAEEERLRRQIEEEIKEKILSSRRTFEDERRRLKAGEFYEKWGWVREKPYVNVLTESALNMLIDAYIKHGYYDMIYPMRSVKRRIDERVKEKGRKARFTATDVQDVLSRWGLAKAPKRYMTLTDSEAKNAVKYCPDSIVEIVWSVVKWKKHRAPVLKRVVRKLLDGREDEFFNLLADAIREVVPKSLWYESRLPEKVRELKNSDMAKWLKWI
ncbi:hypothetical protein B6U84_04105 [Candidatus Bathyarchaeota archaeon ex4484_40]|nr:MAG: hypothetical protein B6U84_04105 [Candidatus Bathyarchaeota archaeon ex4484_40]